MTIKNKIKIEEKYSGMRIDKFLTENLTDHSRSFWQNAINDGLVLVDGTEVNPHYKVKTDMELTIKQREVKVVVEKKKIDLTPDKNIKFKIIFEDKDFLVIDKPAGLTVHPSNGTPKGTLVNGLLAYLPKLKGVGDDKLRPGIVHRLDKDVSGLMVITKNQKAFLHLKKQFKDRKVTKDYLALVYGVINKNEGEINLSIGRSKTSGLMATGATKYKEAKTLFTVQDRYKNYTFLKVQILTGRTHQIRVHMRSIEHPVVGDKMYFLKEFDNIRDFGLNRIFLHSHRLGFKNMDGEYIEFISKLPKELSDAIKTIKD